MFPTFTSFVFLFVCLTHFVPSSGQYLGAEYLSLKLPYPDAYSSYVYDGDDSIYLFGGDNEPHSQILKFSISSETLKVAGNFPGDSRYGTAQIDNHGHIFYIGGGTDHASVYKYDPSTNSTSVVATLPYDIGDSLSIKYNDTSPTVFILGGNSQPNGDVLVFNMDTHNYSIILTNNSINLGNGAAVQVGNKGFIFDDGYPSVSNLQAIAFDLDNYEISRVGPASLPRLFVYPSAVTDGRFAYFMGGYNSGRMNGIIQFNPTTYENNFIQVANFPVNGMSWTRVAPASLFVPSKNAIYCFGGQFYQTSVNQYVTSDEIFVIDLSPLDPPTTPTPITTTSEPVTTTTTEPSSTTMNPDFFSCKNRTNGNYPHPLDCSQFIGCVHERMIFFRCPAPLLFDPVWKVCNYPSQVECGTSCIDKPDGTYPHPHDCSLFITCQSEDTNIFKCPPPLLFDPDQLMCDFPDVVSCSNSRPF